MNDRRDLELVLESGTPLIVIETTDEARVLELLREIALARSASAYRPLFRWSDHGRFAAARSRSRGATAQRRARGSACATFARLPSPASMRCSTFIRSSMSRSTFGCSRTSHWQRPTPRVTLLLIGHRLEVPHELGGFTARFSLRLPDAERSARDRGALRGGVRQRKRPPGQRGRGGARAARPESRAA